CRGMLHKKLHRFWSRFWMAWQSGGIWSALSVGWRDIATTANDRLRPLSSKISSHGYQLIYFLYYGLVFGRPVLGEKRISYIVHMVIIDMSVLIYRMKPFRRCVLRKMKRQFS